MLHHRQIEGAGVLEGAAHRARRSSPAGRRRTARRCRPPSSRRTRPARGPRARARSRPSGAPGKGPTSRALRTMSSVTERQSLTGTVLGMQHTVVKPPAAAAREPVSMSSLYSWPGSRKWTWRSMRPGTTTLPATSISRAPAPAASPRPTSAIRPSAMRTSTAASSGRSAVGSMTRPPRSTRIHRGPGLAARGGGVHRSTSEFAEGVRQSVAKRPGGVPPGRTPMYCYAVKKVLVRCSRIAAGHWTG